MDRCSRWRGGRITHEAPFCPDRNRERRDPNRGREPSQRREPAYRHKPHRERRRQAEANQRIVGETLVQANETRASSSRRPPVRRNILPDLEQSPIRVSTKEWVSKAFRHEKPTTASDKEETLSPGDTEVTRMEDKQSVEKWYRETEEEARKANQTFWEKEKKERIKEEMGRRQRSGKRIGEEKAVEKESKERRLWKADAEIGPDGPELTQHSVGLDGSDEPEAQVRMQVKNKDGVVGNSELGPLMISSPSGIISPLKEFMVRDPIGPRSVELKGKTSGGKRPRRVEKRFCKALGVRKKIGRSPFQGKQIHKHVALVQVESEMAHTALDNSEYPSTSKTGPEKGEYSEESKELVVKERPPAGT